MYINDDDGGYGEDFPEWFNDEPLPVIDPPFDPWENPEEPPVTVDPWENPNDPVITLPEDPTRPPGVPPTAVYDEEKGVWRDIEDTGSSTEYDANGKVVSSYDKDGKVIVGTGIDTKTGYQPGSIQIKNPDGTITSRNTNGSTTTYKPDGSILSQTPASPQGLLDFKKAAEEALKTKDSKDITDFLRKTFAPDGKVSPVAPAIGAIIGMLNRTKGDEGTRGLKDAPKPYVANRQQITQPIGAATGQGQQYFSPTTFTDTPQPQNLPVKTTGGGIEGLRPQPTPTGFPLGYDPNAPQPPRPAPWEEIYRVDETGRPQPTPLPIDVGRRDYPPQEPKPIPQEPKINYDYRKDIPYYMMEPEVDKNGRVTYPPQYEEPRATIPMIPTPVGGGSMPADLPIPPKYNGPIFAGGGLASIPMQEPVSMYAYGGLSNLGGYTHAAGGRMLKGPGDGMSDSIPASIAGKQPARLATDEFVIPADVVSHLGNGSSDAGAKVLYDMMARVRKARTGKAMQGKKINPQKLMPR